MGLLTVNIALSSLTAPGAKSMSSGQKKRVALEAVCGVKTVTRIAQENSTSRQFIRRQAQTLQTVIDKEFTTANERHDDVIFYLPVTKKWIEQLVLALMLVAHASYRNIITILQDVLDYDLSLVFYSQYFQRSGPESEGDPGDGMSIGYRSHRQR